MRRVDSAPFSTPVAAVGRASTKGYPNITELYRRHYDRARVFASKFTGTQFDRLNDEIVQDTFLEVLRRPAWFRRSFISRFYVTLTDVLTTAINRELE